MYLLNWKMEHSGFVENNGMEKEDLVQCDGKSMKSSEGNSCSSGDLKGDTEHIMVLKTRRLSTGKGCNKQLFLPNVCALDNKIPKYIISLDEKYLLRCLEWVHASAFGANSCKISTKMGMISSSLNSGGLSFRNTLDMANLITECPLAVAKNGIVVTDGLSASPTGGSILGTISSSKSMINILRSPLLHQFGSLDSSLNVGSKNLLESKVAKGPELMSSPGRFISNSPKKLKEMVLGDHHRHEFEAADNRFVSSSTTNSTCSDQSSCSLSAAVSQGMLKCTWKDGFPQYVFSVDDQGEVYLANLIKIKSPNEKAVDYIYTFHLKSGGKRESEISDDELNVVGHMKVSTSVSLCPRSSEIMETQFVLSGINDNSAVEIQSSTHASRKNKGLTKKVADAFRTNQSRKLRTYSSFWGTNNILEKTSEDIDKNPDQGLANHVETFMSPNLELAAIVVKDHICENPKKSQLGGWGLNFLKKSGTKQTNALAEASVSPECSQRGDSGECSTSMDILVPAGFHGGPRMRAGGPSGLVERWRSDGHCDCGGWDVGCPLTIINTKVNRTESQDQVHISGECKTIDLIVKGSKQNAAIMKMANIHKDLYYIHFQSTLSALQSFAIAAAIIHSNSPALRPKLYRT